MNPNRTMSSFKTWIAAALIGIAMPMSWAQGNVQILAAWYGQENGQKTEVIRERAVTSYLVEASQSGTLAVPANMNEFFRTDPFPGVAKVLAVQLRHNGVVHNIRQAEGKSLVFPGVIGVTYLPAPHGQSLNLRAAWYGTEGSAASGAALERVRSGMLNGYVHVPADMNKFFQGDPMPGKVKRVALTVDYNGRTVNLRQVEGVALTFPGVPGQDYLELLDAPLASVKAVFNPTFYALKYPDLQEAFGTNADALWNHYVNYGMKEGRDPHPEISIGALKARYPFLQTLYGTDYAKYVGHLVAANALGAGMNGNPANNQFNDKGIFADSRLAFFDVDYYFKKNPAVCAVRSLTIPADRAASNCSLPAGVFFDVPALQEHFITHGFARSLKAHNHPTGAAQSAHQRESMRTGDWLGVNQYLLSRNGVNIAILQSNADFAVYRTNNPAAISSANYVGLHSNNTSSDNRNGFFITMQGDGRLCTYKGTSPSDNKGFVGCATPSRGQDSYYLHLQSDNNLVIRYGDSVFNDRGYAWDFRTTKSASPNVLSLAFSAIQSAVGCR